MSNKRNYNDILGECKSVGADQTLVRAVVIRVKPPKNPSNTKSPWGVMAKYIGDESVLVTFQKPNKKQKGDDGYVANPEQVVHTDEDGNDILGGTIKPGENFYVNCFANNISIVKEGFMVGFALNSNFYTDPKTEQSRITYKASKVIIDSSSNTLTKKVYDSVIANTSLAEVPTRYNINPDDFPLGTEKKYMVRQFILPLFSITGLDVEIVLQNNVDRLYCKKEEEYAVGYNTDDGGKTTNHLGVVYKRGDGMKEIMFKFAYNYDFWTQIGVLDVDIWKKIGHQLVNGFKNTYVYGGSDLARILGMTLNIHDFEPEEEDDDPNDILVSTGFISQIGCDMAATARNIGIKLSLDYMITNYGNESDYSYTKEMVGHPLNGGWKMKLESASTQVINFTELNDDQLPKFWKQIKDKDNIEFWGVPSNENISDLENPDQDPAHPPAAIFVVVN